jgi:integrase
LTEDSREKRWLLKDYVMMLLDTGARAGKELLNLKWNQIRTEINPQFIETGKLEANEWGEAEEVLDFNLNRLVWMPVDGKTGPRTILAFDRFYRALNNIAQRNYGKTADQVLALKLDDYVIRTKAKEQPKKFLEMFKSYLKQNGLLIDPKTGKSRCLYCVRHTFATLLMEKDAVDVFLLELQMGTSVEMIRKHYGHVSILKAAEHLKAGRARQLFRGVGSLNEVYRSKLVG